jgi:hypothetical protein
VRKLNSQLDVHLQNAHVRKLNSQLDVHLQNALACIETLEGLHTDTEDGAGWVRKGLNAVKEFLKKRSAVATKEEIEMSRKSREATTKLQVKKDKRSAEIREGHDSESDSGDYSEKPPRTSRNRYTVPDALL